MTKKTDAKNLSDAAFCRSVVRVWHSAQIKGLSDAGSRLDSALTEYAEALRKVGNWPIDGEFSSGKENTYKEIADTLFLLEEKGGTYEMAMDILNKANDVSVPNG